MTEIKAGIYEHFKGRRYRVIGIVKHSETMEDLVLYEPLYESEHKLWVRPVNMFLESVLHNGKKVPRFRFIE
ncbi:MAG: DUF1653 domain-containing protein [Candidatus Aenigmatarchaeota archaeon]